MADTQNVIKTKIKLRSDSEENWTKANPKLERGEASIVFTEDGKTKIKVGDGSPDKKWSDLAYVGGDTEQHYTTDDITKLSATYNPGDIAIETKTISGDKVSKTAYVWNGDDWAAMDGNYNANNVYFDSNITITQAFGNNTIDGNTGRGTIACAGWNVRELISKSFSKATSAGQKAPSKTFGGPSSIGGSGYEVGTWLTDAQEVNARSAVSFKYSDGSWSAYNGTTKAGNRVELSNVTASRTTLISDTDITNYGITVNKTAINKTYTNDTSAVLAPSTTATNLITALGTADLSVQVRDTGYNLFKWSASAKCNAGTVTPVNNLGDADPDNKVPGADWSDNDNTVAVNAGYRSMFIGAIGTKPTTINSEVIRGLRNCGEVKGATVEVKNGTDYWASGLTNPACIIVAIPTKNKGSNITTKLSQVLLKSSANTPITGLYVLQTATVDVKGVNGYTSVPYKVWVYSPASIAANEVHTITIS